MILTDKDIWVFIELNENKTPKHVGLELLNPGKKLAKELTGNLIAVIISDETALAKEEASRYGADKILVIEGSEYEYYSTDAYATAFSYLINKYQPAAVMIGATINGRDLAPRIACRVKTGLTADCTELGIDEKTGRIAWTRPALGGNLMATILCEDHTPQMGTVRSGVFKKLEPTDHQAEIIEEHFTFDMASIRTQILETIQSNKEVVNLESAEFIVAAGRGVGTQDGFDKVVNFAKNMGATLGASRGAVEQGWVPHTHQIGQTGKNVSPKVYFAFGISGAIQHIAGINGSDKIVAINKDPNAPIFNISDISVVGDLFEILPILELNLTHKSENP